MSDFKHEGRDHVCATWFFNLLDQSFAIDTWNCLYIQMPRSDLHASPQTRLRCNTIFYSPPDSTIPLIILSLQVQVRIVMYGLHLLSKDTWIWVTSKEQARHKAARLGMVDTIPVLMRYQCDAESSEMSLPMGPFGACIWKSLKFIDLLDKRSGTSHRRCVIGGHQWHYGPAQCRMMSYLEMIYHSGSTKSILFIAKLLEQHFDISQALQENTLIGQWYWRCRQ